MKNKIYLAMPSWDGKIPVNMTSFLISLQKYSKHEIIPTFTSKSVTCNARNYLLEDFLKSDCSHILWLDDDNRPEDIFFIDKMISDNKDIVSALVPSRRPVKWDKHWLCILYEWFKETGEHEYLQYFEKPNINGLIEIANCWFGCVLMKKKVCKDILENFSHPFEFRTVWYFKINSVWVRDDTVDYSLITDWTLRFRRYMAEDLLFMERARNLWYKIYADTEVYCNHIWDSNIITVKSHILNN